MTTRWLGILLVLVMCFSSVTAEAGHRKRCKPPRVVKSCRVVCPVPSCAVPCSPGHVASACGVPCQTFLYGGCCYAAYSSSHTSCPTLMIAELEMEDEMGNPQTVCIFELTDCTVNPPVVSTGYANCNTTTMCCRNGKCEGCDETSEPAPDEEFRTERTPGFQHGVWVQFGYRPFASNLLVKDVSAYLKDSDPGKWPRRQNNILHVGTVQAKTEPNASPKRFALYTWEQDCRVLHFGVRIADLKNPDPDERIVSEHDLKRLEESPNNNSEQEAVLNVPDGEGRRRYFHLFGLKY